MTTKSRNINKLDYFNILVKEYYREFLRSKIRPKKKDRDYHEKVMTFKLGKIRDLNTKNGFVEDLDEFLILKRAELINVFPPLVLSGSDHKDYYLEGQAFMVKEKGTEVFILEEVGENDLKIAPETGAAFWVSKNSARRVI